MTSHLFAYLRSTEIFAVFRACRQRNLCPKNPLNCAKGYKKSVLHVKNFFGEIGHTPLSNNAIKGGDQKWPKKRKYFMDSPIVKTMRLKRTDKECHRNTSTFDSVIIRDYSNSC